jgi:hypothetical protein
VTWAGGASLAKRTESPATDPVVLLISTIVTQLAGVSARTSSGVVLVNASDRPFT